MNEQLNVVIGITGAHSVGKTTFCQGLGSYLADRGYPLTILDGLGDQVRSLGIPVGATANSDTVALIYSAHLEREQNLRGGMFLLDRSTIDALAYVKALGVNTEAEKALYERVTQLSSRQYHLSIHLRLSPFFADMCDEHETPLLRRAVDAHIAEILRSQSASHVSFDASSVEAIPIAAMEIGKLVSASR
ncbi:AAA family ATPase [Tsuneonella rigui]|uniref:AAA family ATPase n=1 Tax=Tsuneonella rigui TaxID=1708790 RepID=UPI0013E015AD|nr:AAA family ATPase [Tsuneonella rigui]